MAAFGVAHRHIFTLQQSGEQIDLTSTLPSEWDRDQWEIVAVLVLEHIARHIGTDAASLVEDLAVVIDEVDTSIMVRHTAQ